MPHPPLGIAPEPLSMAPFIVTAHTLPPARASDLGVRVHPRAPAFVFPSLGAYVGGDIVAGLVHAGLLDHSGRFADEAAAAQAHPALAERLTKVGEERVFVLHPRGDDPANAVYLSQRDVRELQFAKASIATGWQILLRERAEARSILDEVEYVELSGRADFNDMFVDQLAFPG